tara:strand:- start:9187 stop:10041 length:855 start_codon:yes stop_codon:yes gene_type:complete
MGSDNSKIMPTISSNNKNNNVNIKSLDKCIFKNLPNEMIHEICSYLYNDIISPYLTTIYIKCRGHILLSIYLSFKIPNIRLLMKEIKQINFYINKYFVYQYDYDNHIHSLLSSRWTWVGRRRGICGGFPVTPEIIAQKYNIFQIIESNNHNLNRCNSNPILIDILSTGSTLPLAYSTYTTFQTYNNKIHEKAIWEVLKLFPECIYSNFGSLRCRNNITPIAAACYNYGISLVIIESLIKMYPDFNRKIISNGNEIDLIEDINSLGLSGSSTQRNINLSKIFDNY